MLGHAGVKPMELGLPKVIPVLQTMRPLSSVC